MGKQIDFPIPAVDFLANVPSRSLIGCSVRRIPQVRTDSSSTFDLLRVDVHEEHALLRAEGTDRFP